MAITSRNKLEAEVIGICQILQSWYLAGIIKKAADVDLAPLESEEEFENGNSDDEDDETELQNVSEELVTSEDSE
jgi:hypothetical protein